MTLFFILLACFTETGPCTDYCNYICDCHAGEEGYDCDSCFTVYSSADAQQQDECETSLADLRAEDQEAGNTCRDTEDSGI